MERQNVWPYSITNSLTNCFTMWAMAELTVQTHSHLGIGLWKKREWKREGKVSKGVSLVMIQPFAWEKKRFLWNDKSAHITWPLTLNLSTPWMQTNLHHVRVSPQSSHFSARRSIFHDITIFAHITRPLTSTLILSTSWTQGRLGTILCKFGGDPALLSGRSNFCEIRKNARIT